MLFIKKEKLRKSMVFRENILKVLYNIRMFYIYICITINFEKHEKNFVCYVIVFWDEYGKRSDV